MMNVWLFSRARVALLCLMSTGVSGAAESQLVSNQQAGTSVLLAKTISIGWSTNETLLGHIEVIRHTIMPIGLEMDITTKREIDVSKKLFKEESVGGHVVSVTVSNDTLAGVLDKIVNQYLGYTWRLDGSTACIDVYPTDNAVCAKTLTPYSIKAQSIEGIFANSMPELKELNIGLAPQYGRARPIYQNLIVDLDFQGGTLMDFLNRLTLAIGERVSWTLESGYKQLTLIFNVPTDVRTLYSYKPAWDEGMSASEKLAKKKELLVKATNDAERRHLLLDVAVLYAETGDKLMAAKTFDDAIQAAVSDEDRCVIKEESVQLLHAINKPAEAERAIEIYREILRSCPYERTRVKAILDLAYVLYSVDREAEVVALLKDGADQYPRSVDLIRKTMKAYYPSHLEELPQPPVTTSNGIPLIFYQSQGSNRPEKEIHFNFK